MKQRMIKNYWLTLFLLVLLSLLCLGCQDKNASTPDKIQITEPPGATTEPYIPDVTKDQTADAPPSTSPTTNVQGAAPSIDQVADDLLYLKCNYFSLDGDDTCLDIKNLQLEHIQQGIPYDIYRYHVEYGNDYYKVDAVYNLQYVYDGEYWVLGNCILDSSKSSAIKSQIDQTKVINRCDGCFDSYELTSHEYWTDENGVFTDVITFQGTLTSKYFTEVFIGTYTYTFENDYWHENWKITPQTIDWQYVEGTWTLEHYDEFITINIESIVQQDKKITITYSYETSPWYDDGPWDGYFRSDCNGSSRSETKLQRTCEIDFYYSDLVGDTKCRRLDTYAFVLPIQIGGWEVTWDQGFFYLFFDIEKGLCIHEFNYLYKNPDQSTIQAGNDNYWGSDANEKTVYFKKVIDYDKLQEAIDKLKDMNS